ncbi:MAG: DsrE family protein [Gammaproteobacteria bacterium]|nr:DsrE family protein [Gammaproteobacteria bacterium]
MFVRSGLLVLMLVLPTSLWAAEARSGPVISNFGPVYDVADDAWNLEEGKAYKVSMDVSATADFSGDLNRRIESAARFLNMHARNGIAMENIDFAIVVHGSAGKDLLNDAAYKARFDEVNPNTTMLSALAEAGVEIYLCGQTAAHRGLASGDLHPAVTVALSAMTAHVRLQSQGYTLIPF